MIYSSEQYNCDISSGQHYINVQFWTVYYLHTVLDSTTVTFNSKQYNIDLKLYTMQRHYANNMELAYLDHLDVKQ